MVVDYYWRGQILARTLNFQAFVGETDQNGDQKFDPFQAAHNKGKVVVSSFQETIVAFEMSA